MFDLIPYNELPIEVKEIIDKYSNLEPSYNTCANLVKELESVGWTCEYYLDAIPFNLHKV